MEGDFFTLNDNSFTHFVYFECLRGDFSQIMEKGSSLHWSEVLQSTIGESRLDPSAMREYFQPLEEWLQKELFRTQEFVGWLYDGDYCKRSIETAGLQVFGGFYNAAFHPQQSLVLFYLCHIILCVTCRHLLRFEGAIV